MVKLSNGAVLWSSCYMMATRAVDFTISLSNETVHWGYFSKDTPPTLTIPSGSVVTVEMATHHAW